MMHTIYRPGQWNTLVAPGALVALPSDASEALVSTLWERLKAERTLAVVVDAITDSVGGSFSAMPPFVAVVVEGANARVALRGDLTADVTGTEGVQSLSGADVLTWNERYIPGASRIVLRLGDAVGAPELPVIGGVVRAAEVVADVEAADAEAAGVEAAGVESADGESADGAAAVIGAAGVAAAGIAAAPAIAAGGEPAGADASPAESAPVADAQDTDAPSSDAPDTAAPSSDAPAVSFDDLVWPPTEADAAEAQNSESESEPAAEPVPAAGSDAPTEAIAVDSSTDDQPEPSASPEPAAPAPLAAEPSADAAQDPQAEDISGETLVPAEQTIGSDFDEFEQLFGDTVHSVPSTAPTPPAAPIAGDHDGATISVAEARALRRDLPPVPQLEPEAPTALLPTVGGGRIRVSTGQVVALDRTVVIGRRPRAPRASGASLPHLIAVESPQQDISRSHLEVRPEGDTVVVIDLHTTNGSTLLRPGADPVRLHPGEQTLVLSGDVIDLGDGVTVAFEDLP
ncbi:FHA domain-containing protein [Microbacterium sp. GXF0217]